MPTIHAFDLFDSDLPEGNKMIVPVFGNDRFLRQRAVSELVRSLKQGEGEPDDGSDFSTAKFEGDSASWSDVYDELSTVSLFDSGKRIAVVQDADKFVKDHRESIEDLGEKKIDGCLILCVGSWPANTRLYKHCDKKFLQIDVGPPQVKKGRSKSRDDKRIADWIVAHGKSEYGIKLGTPAARQMIDLLDDDFGRMDQELAKISLIEGGKKEITPQTILEIVGGWKATSVWQAIDHATDGDLDQAFELLNRLLQTGEHPLALYGQLSWSLRRFGQACEYFLSSQRKGSPIAIRESLKQAGFRSWGNELENAERRMKAMGRKKASHIHQWLLETDLALKGSHSNENRARLALEVLFAKLAA